MAFDSNDPLGDGGDGGDARSTLMIGHSEGGALDLLVRATGGSGGQGAVGGAAGDGTASAWGIRGSAPVSVTAVASGGNAGRSADAAPGASGGSALATATGLATGTEPVVSSALATGGSEQPAGAIPSLASLGGDAEASSTSLGFGSVLADAIANAGFSTSTGRSGLARAYAEASGASGAASARANVRGAGRFAVTTRAEAPVSSRVTAEARSAVARSAFDRGLGAGRDAFSFVTGAPSLEDLAAVLAGNATALGAIDEERALALGSLGFAPDEPARGAPLVAEVSLTFGPGSDDIAGVLGVSFLNVEAEGEFGSLHFVAQRGAQVLFDVALADPAAVLAFFDDTVIELADFADGASRSEDFTLLFELDAPEAGAAFSLDYVIASVPEPSTASLLGIGLVALTCARRVAGARSAVRVGRSARARAWTERDPCYLGDGGRVVRGRLG